MIDPTIHPDLVYDLGAHNGDDTASYLSQGYRVVSVEPTPSLAGLLQQRFAPAIKDRRLFVLNAAITDEDSEKVTFYVSQADWKSSLIKDISSRESIVDEIIEIPAKTIVSLFREFGVPGYCKMDIEGYDSRVIASMRSGAFRPSFLSCEACCYRISEINSREALLYQTLDALQGVGYTAFKLVDQEGFAVLADQEHYSYLHSIPGRITAKFRKLTGHRLPATAPFGERLPGEWADYITAKKYLAYHFREYFRFTQNKEQIFWVDIHAKWPAE
ncbi:MAG TPA: FkbM family methyltransferase [Puia sp.]|jgi:FkbM family methyltransferase